MASPRLFSLFRYLLRKKDYIFFFAVAVGLLVLFTAQVRAFLILAALGFAATFSTFYKRVFQAPPVLELLTLSTVAVSIFYNPWIGVFFTIVVSIASEVASQALDPFSVTYIFPRIVMCFVAPWLYANGVGLGLLGLFSSLIYNGLQQPVYWWLTDPEKRIKAVYFSSLNIPTNFLVFKFLGEPLFSLLGLLLPA